MNELPVRRNTLLLSASLAANSAMLQLSAAVASLTLVLVIGVDQLLGLGPAIVLASGALAALPAGRAMDRFGRVPVLAAGFATGGLGGALAGLGSKLESAPVVLAGLLCVGAASGTALLARTAAGDMYPPERRAHGIALVLFGAVFGAILGPLVFSPLLAGPRARRRLAGAAVVVVGRLHGRRAGARAARAPRSEEDRRDAAHRRRGRGARADRTAAPLREIVRRPGVLPALVAGQASFAVMVGIMTLTGSVVVDHHHHAGHSVFPIIGAHVFGMYALVLVIGTLIDRIGRRPSLAGGLLVMAVSALSLLWVESVPATAVVAVRPRHRLEPLLRGRHRHAGRLRRAVGARQAAGLQRPAGGDDRRRARARGRPRAVGDRRGGAGDRRRRARARARRVDPARAAAAHAR